MVSEKIMSLNEICSYLQLTKSTIYKLSQRGDLPSSRIGRQLRFRKFKVDAWLDQKERKKQKLSRRRKKTRR